MADHLDHIISNSQYNNRNNQKQLIDLSKKKVNLKL